MAIDSLAGMKSDISKVSKQLQSMQGVLGGRGLVFSMRDLAKSTQKQNELAKLNNTEFKKMVVILPKINASLSLTNRRLNLFAANLNTAKDAVRAFTRALGKGGSGSSGGQKIVFPPKAPAGAAAGPGKGGGTAPSSTLPSLPGGSNVNRRSQYILGEKMARDVEERTITGKLKWMMKDQLKPLQRKNIVQEMGQTMQQGGFGVLGRLVSTFGNAIKIAMTPILAVGAILAAAAALLLMAGRSLVQAGVTMAHGGLGFNQTKGELGNLGGSSKLINQRYNLSYAGAAGDIQAITESRLAAISVMGKRTNNELITNMSAAEMWGKRVYGVSEKTSAKLMALTTRLSSGSATAGRNMLEVAAAFGEVNDANIQDLLENMASNTEEMAKSSGRMAEGFVKGSIMAQRMGISMGTVSGLMDKFSTDFEGTLEMQAKIQTFAPGVNLNEAIYAANFGTQQQFLSAMNASMSQLGGIDNMSRGMQVTLAKSFGMSVEEMKNFIKSKGETIKDVTPEDIKKATQSTDNKMGDLVAGGISGLLKSIASDVALIASWSIFGGKKPTAEQSAAKYQQNVAESSKFTTKYHTGGLAHDELSAVLRKGEIVLTPTQQKAIGAMINEGMIQRDKLQQQFSQFKGGSGPGLEYALSSMGVNPSLASKSGRQSFAIQSAGKVANKLGAGKLLTGLASKALGATSIGSKIGGMIGSVIPGAGTLVGALAGGMIGKGVSKIGKAIGGLFGKKKKKAEPAPELQSLAQYSPAYSAGGGEMGSSADVVMKLDQMLQLLRNGGVQVYLDGKKVSDGLVSANRG